MRIKIHVIYAILYIILHINPLIAQSDSCKAEIGLDFLIGRIVGGIGTGIHYDQSRRSPGTIYEGYRPEILLAKANLLCLSLSDYSSRATSTSNKNWSHLPEIRITYRSEKSLQFYFENTYLLNRNDDYKQKTINN